MDLNLRDKVALVAASSDGLGLATGIELAREGAKVIINGRDDERLARALLTIKENVVNAQVIAITADLTKADQIKDLVKKSVDQFGGIDILITNAGGPPTGVFETVELETWKTGFDLTFMSVVHLVQNCLEYLKKSDAASILTITSSSTKQPIAGLILSNVFRPAVAGLTKTLSRELGKDNIRVNSILPGMTATNRSKDLIKRWAIAKGVSVEEELERILLTIPLGRMAKPSEFGKTATFLVSSAASHIHGVMLQVDGGAYAGLL